MFWCFGSFDTLWLRNAPEFVRTATNYPFFAFHHKERVISFIQIFIDED